MAPRSLRKHSWVVRLARGLFSHYKDLHTFDKDRERNSESKGRRGKSLCLFSEGRKFVFALILIPALEISQYSQRLTLYTVFSLHLFIFNFILPCKFFQVIFLDRYINSQLNIIYSLYINSQFLCQEEDSVNLVKWLTAFGFKHLGATVWSCCSSIRWSSDQCQAGAMCWGPKTIDEPLPSWRLWTITFQEICE